MFETNIDLSSFLGFLVILVMHVGESDDIEFCRPTRRLTLASISATFSGVAKACSRKGLSVADIAPADPPSDTALFRLDEWATLTAVTCQSSDRKEAGISKPL